MYGNPPRSHKLLIAQTAFGKQEKAVPGRPHGVRRERLLYLRPGSQMAKAERCYRLNLGSIPSRVSGRAGSG